MAKRVFKTKKKLSGGKYSFRKWGDWEVGDIVIGTFVGMHMDQYKKEGTIITVEDAQFKDKKEAKALIGKTLVLNAAGKLNKAVADLTEGDIIQVTYNGTSEIEKGKFKGKDAHDIEVDLCEEESNDEDGEELEDEDESEDDADEDDEDL